LQPIIVLGHGNVIKAQNNPTQIFRQNERLRTCPPHSISAAKSSRTVGNLIIENPNYQNLSPAKTTPQKIKKLEVA
jgi:hypothetical protein